MATQYSAEVKAQVMAALLMGQRITDAAKEYKIPESTIKGWAKRLRDEVYPQVVAGDVQRERIGGLILDNVEAMLEATKELMNVVKDKEWLKKQSASEIAVFFGVVSDKTYRLLEALPDGSADQPGREGETAVPGVDSQD